MLHSICQQIWKTQQCSQDWKRLDFIPIPKKGNAKECTVPLIAHTSKVMLRILQARLQQYMNHEIPKVHSGFKKGRGTRDQIAKECTIPLISHTSKVMLRILQAKLQQYMNHETPKVHSGFRKGRGTRDLIANIHWIIKKPREFQKNIYSCFTEYAKAWDCVEYNKLENS